MNLLKLQRNIFFPDKTLAIKLLKEYTKPLLIDTKSQASESELLGKFGKYLNLLACLNNSVRIVEKGGILEIYGPPEKRGAILAYFAEIEDRLTGDDIEKIIIFPDVENQSIGKTYDSFLDILFHHAKDFAAKALFSPPNHLTNIRFNENLKHGSPALIKFLNALKKNKLDPLNINIDDILTKGVFGWHGTRTADNVASIAYANLDPGKRRCRFPGYGEYCAADPNYSIGGGYWGDTESLFVFFILKIDPFYKFNSAHIVDNPKDLNEMYMIPILVATFNNHQPIPLVTNKIKYDPKFEWEWLDDPCWTLYGKGQPIEMESQVMIERMYQKYLDDKKNSTFVLTLVRLNDKKTKPYEINFQTMKQKNQDSSYMRDIKRQQKNIYM